MVFGEHELLLDVKNLIDVHGVYRSTDAAVSYIHFMFERREIVYSDQMWSGSFQPGHQALAGLEAAQRDEIYDLFPELQSQPDMVFQTARRVAQKYETRLLF